MSRPPINLVAAAACAAWLAPFVHAIEITRTLDPSIDTIGQQILAVQTYTSGTTTVLDLAIYDTGASVISFAAYANEFFPPHLNPGGAGGQGINGSVVGDVSQPGAILAGGFQDFRVNVGLDPFAIEVGIDTPPNRAVPGIQAFVASLDGSPNLPSLAGTPIHKPSDAFPNGSAAFVSFSGIDFAPTLGLSEGSLFIPMLDLVAPGGALETKLGSTQPATIPLARFGGDNYSDPGSSITSVSNPTVANVGLGAFGNGGEPVSTTAASMLFDTGAQVSLISTALATSLRLDLDNPDTTIAVRGAAGAAISIPGFTLSEIILGAAIDGPEVDDTLRFLDVPVYVYDIGVPGLDGILGMNLFNQANEMLIDLVNNRLSVSFYDGLPTDGGGDSLVDLDQALAALVGTSFSPFAGNLVPAFGLGPIVAVPEPSTLVALAGGLAVAMFRLRRRRFRARAQRVAFPSTGRSCVLCGGR